MGEVRLGLGLILGVVAYLGFILHELKGIPWRLNNPPPPPPTI